MREPVARLYSEYQMERRRTVPQKRFLNKLREHAASLLLCYARNSGALPTNETFAQCVRRPRPFVAATARRCQVPSPRVPRTAPAPRPLRPGVAARGASTMAAAAAVRASERRASRAFWLAVADRRRALSVAADAAALALALMDCLGSAAASVLPDDLKGFRPSLREKMLIVHEDASIHEDASAAWLDAVAGLANQ